jgi:3-dehydroquinate synthetase
LASYEKVVKYVTDRFETALTPLQAMIKNQEIIIVQNKQMVELLEKIRLNGTQSLERPEEVSVPEEEQSKEQKEEA